MRSQHVLYLLISPFLLSTWSHAFPLTPVVITGDPVAPYIANKTGTGFCSASRQAVSYQAVIPNFGTVNYDGVNILPSEVLGIPIGAGGAIIDASCRTIYTFNNTSVGKSAPVFMNCFFDGGFFPSQAGGPIHYEKFPLTSGFVEYFDFASTSDPKDPNGDFIEVDHGSISKGKFFPVALGPNSQNFNPAAPFPENIYRDFFVSQAFPEASPNDSIHNTETRFRAFLNVPPTWAGHNVVFGMYADDGASVAIYDANRHQEVIISAARNRCHPCQNDSTTGHRFACSVSEGTCGGMQSCFSDDECAARNNGVCDPTRHVCVQQACTKDADCSGKGLGGICNLTTHSCVSNKCATDQDCGCKPGENCIADGKYCNKTTGACAEQWCQPCDMTQTGMRWRITNTVYFQKSGLYPIEILHEQYAGNAALELSYRVLQDGETFTNVYDGWGFPLDEDQRENIWKTYFANAHSLPLTARSMTLFDSTMFFQTTTGEPLSCEIYGQCSTQDLSVCRDPNFNGPPISNVPLSCGAGTFCNPAGLCQPCTTNEACGENTCEKCPANQTCVLVNGLHQCAECASDQDCSLGKTCQNGSCICTDHSQCPKGQSCNNTHCETCNSDLSCASNSCACCSGTANKCLQLDKNQPGSFACVQCLTQKECNPNNDPNINCNMYCNPNNDPGNHLVCDPVNHRCVDSIPNCNTDKHCGNRCDPCPANQPYCLNGQVCVQCRADSDCPNAQYCLSGQCAPCTSDRKCGPFCRTCSQNQPFCFSTGDPAKASCVACFQDDQCGPGGSCDLATHQCQNACTLSCPKGQFCQGARCIECVSSAQCPCGSSCDTSTGTCSPGCQDTSDCLSDECCFAETHQCSLGHCSVDTTFRGGALCCALTTPGAVTAQTGSLHSMGYYILILLLSMGTLLSLGVVSNRYRKFSRTDKAN